jgi:hypothetical protein
LFDIGDSGVEVVGIQFHDIGYQGMLKNSIDKFIYNQEMYEP